MRRLRFVSVFNYLQQSSINMPTCIIICMYYMCMCVFVYNIFDMIRIFVALCWGDLCQLRMSTRRMRYFWPCCLRFRLRALCCHFRANVIVIVLALASHLSINKSKVKLFTQRERERVEVFFVCVMLWRTLWKSFNGNICSIMQQQQQQLLQQQQLQQQFIVAIFLHCSRNSHRAYIFR